tara:strand:+ start:9447 stop:9590 length:144 start_codon:yes stop_codon:yes gene_type:complete
MASKWIEHVKAYATKNKISYKEAMSKARPSYKSDKKVVDKKVKKEKK